jgi:hypothetical protein
MSRKIAHQTHPLVYYCKQLCQNGIWVLLMWIPSYIGLVGNELVDDPAQQVALEGTIFDRPLSSSNFQSLARPALMRAWQAKWAPADTGRFTLSVFPDVKLRPSGKKGLYALFQGFYLDIALFDCTSVDFELLKIWCVCVCVCVCNWLWDSRSLD